MRPRGSAWVSIWLAYGKTDLNLYRSAGSEVVTILSSKGKCERASIDEVYLDITDAAKPQYFQEYSDKEKNVRECLCRVDDDYQDRLLACGAIIVAQMLANLVSGMHIQACSINSCPFFISPRL